MPGVRQERLQSSAARRSSISASDPLARRGSPRRCPSAAAPAAGFCTRYDFGRPRASWRAAAATLEAPARYSKAAGKVHELKLVCYPARSRRCTSPIARLVLCSGLVCSACGAPQLSIYSRGAEDWTDARWWALPGYGRSPLGRPYVACDRLGRCWQLGPSDRYALGHVKRPNTWPPNWAGSIPGSA
jgi:hypothetical protein